MQISPSVLLNLRRAEVWVPWAVTAVRVLLIAVVAWILTGIVGRLLDHMRVYAIEIMARRREGADPELAKRAATIVAVLRKMAASAIWIIALVMALRELQYDIEPLLAGLGIAGLALGLGAQTLIKDWLGGLFLLIEDQIRIGDSVAINGVSGVVQEINLRTTVLRAESGAVHVIPNGSITALANLTREYSFYIFETTLAHRADAGKALEILEETGAAIAGEERFRPVVLAPLEMMGVDRLGERGAVIRARIKTLPGEQSTVGRELNRRVKERFDAAGILFPPPPCP